MLLLLTFLFCLSFSLTTVVLFISFLLTILICWKKRYMFLFNCLSYLVKLFQISDRENSVQTFPFSKTSVCLHCELLSHLYYSL